MAPINVDAKDQIDFLRSARNEYIEQFRIHGTRDSVKADMIQTRLKSIVDTTNGEQQARALYELATIERITDQFPEAIQHYTRAATIADTFENRSLAFDSWLGVARAYVYGSREHGAAAEAFRQVVARAGREPTAKQRYDMADYNSQLQASRGELKAALLNGLEAVSAAQKDDDLFYAYLDTGDVLQKFAESCDFQKLIDAKTVDDVDSWGACRRAVGAAKTYYSQARATAKRLGWHFLEKEVDGFLGRLDIRLFLIEQKASFEKIGKTSVFQAQQVSDVLVNEDFSAGASELSESLPIGAVLDEVVPEAEAKDPRSIYLRGVKADLDGQKEVALSYFQRAAKLLDDERSGWFDIRYRGTVVENRPELIRDLALRFLDLGHFEEAFHAFESIRSRGLSELVTAFKRNEFSESERQWLSDVVRTESQVSEIESQLVETIIAGVEHRQSIQLTKDLHNLKQKRHNLLAQQRFQGAIEKLASSKVVPPTLEELTTVVRKTDIPVVLYWVTPTNVIVWVVSPEGMEVKTVFLSEFAVLDKVARVVDSAKNPGKPFDAVAAKELHTYLLQPFSKYLQHEQILIIPHGPLIHLPFEALINGATNKFLVETTAISYAQNVLLAHDALHQALLPIANVFAIYDQFIEENTNEIAKLNAISMPSLTSMASNGMTPKQASSALNGKESIHVLLHGEFNTSDPLQSKLSLGSTKNAHSITAANLLQVDWSKTRLAVLGSCQGANVHGRISNEYHGFSWALIAGGVDHVVLSRWRVQAVGHADWMTAFYDALVQHRYSPAKAAGTAMRKMIRNGQRHPYYWAGPQVFGR